MKPAGAAAKGVAFVTGASSGIGRAVALALARRGWRVAALARRAEALAALAAEAPGVTAFPGDACDRAGVAAAVAKIEAELGPITLAFLNHGVYFPAEREDFDVDVAWRTFEINVGGVLNCLGPLLAAMRARQNGRIAITSSLAALGGVPGSMAYGASKAALTYMAEVLRMSCARDHIEVQVVHPGFVTTAMTEHADFDMPFLMSAAEAAEIICDGFGTERFEIVFPRRLALLFRAARLLPYPLYFAAMRRAARRADRSG
ncbi:SDR family NAD(P)-dependent oxidoreductase [Methylocella sp.]|uniref:SDR family NAD(P)-dependent oxidoreductase n=1 Tax=Methylocella sp. TaxID=1978226 RepID=UPI003783A90F